MKLLKLLVLSAMVLMATVGASNGAPASILTAQPSEPAATSPANGALVGYYSAGAVEFQWSNSGSMATTSYDIEISTDPTFTNYNLSVMVSSNDNGHSHSNCGATSQAPNFTSPISFLPATTYYWRVQAYDNALCNGNDFISGGSGWAVYSFETSIQPPSLLSP